MRCWRELKSCASWERYPETFSNWLCCRVGNSVQGFKRVGHGLFFGLVMEPCVLRLLSVWIRSGFERNVWQARRYSSNVVGFVFSSSICARASASSARLRSCSARSSASLRLRRSSSALSSASLRLRRSSSALSSATRVPSHAHLLLGATAQDVRNLIPV